ncbi:hypothetical protein BROUX41_003680 [Berkeleyomyces rouxiae]
MNLGAAPRLLPHGCGSALLSRAAAAAARFPPCPTHIVHSIPPPPSSRFFHSATAPLLSRPAFVRPLAAACPAPGKRHHQLGLRAHNGFGLACSAPTSGQRMFGFLSLLTKPRDKESNAASVNSTPPLSPPSTPNTPPSPAPSIPTSVVTSKASRATTKAADDDSELLEAAGFERSERAAKAAQVNLSARLAKDGKPANTDYNDLWRLLRIARPEMTWLLAACGLLVLSSSVTMSLPWVIGRLLDIMNNSNPDDVRILGLGLNYFFIALASVFTLGAVSNMGRIILLRIVGERVVARLRTTLYRRTFVQDAEFYDANRVGDLISRLGSDAVIVGKSITQNLSDGLRALFAGAFGFSAMIWLSPKLSALLLIAGPPVAFGGLLYGRTIRNISKSIQKNLGTLTKIAEERLGNVRTSQAFVGEIQEVHRYNKQVRRIFDLGRREAITAATFFASTGWVGNMTVIGMLVVGGNLVRNGSMSTGDLTSFMMYTAFAGNSLFGLSNFYSELMKGLGAASRLFELQDREPKIHQTVGSKVKSAQGMIEFRDVNFSYPTRPAVSIFNGLNFTIPSGSNVCIVGPSGGGKSTVASLLLRFYAPTKGTISINDTDISTMNAKSLRRRIGVVSQEPVLFSGTIAENIAYAKPNATRLEIYQAARKANCTFISDLPDGLDTQVGARGSQLSGGQKQRIAIARSLIKDPDVLILDEATSALDAESETLVNEALIALLKGRNTTISIAHRLSTIKRSDQLIVLNSEGTVAEIGSYTELSANPESAFSRLMEWQMNGGEPVAGESRRNAGITEDEEIQEDLEKREQEEEAEVGSGEKPKN